MSNFEAVIPDFFIILGMGIILVTLAELLLYLKVKSGIINKLGFPFLFFHYFAV
jgi:hypothetical protein